MKKNTIFINHVREVRKAQGLTMQELADKVGCSINSIGSIERYEFQPTAFTAGLICKALGCTFEDLFEYVEGKKEPD